MPATTSLPFFGQTVTISPDFTVECVQFGELFQLNLPGRPKIGETAKINYRDLNSTSQKSGLHSSEQTTQFQGSKNVFRWEKEIEKNWWKLGLAPDEYTNNRDVVMSAIKQDTRPVNGRNINPCSIFPHRLQTISTQLCRKSTGTKKLRFRKKNKPVKEQFPALEIILLDKLQRKSR